MRDFVIVVLLLPDLASSSDPDWNRKRQNWVVQTRATWSLIDGRDLHRRLGVCLKAAGKGVRLPSTLQLQAYQAWMVFRNAWHIPYRVGHKSRVRLHCAWPLCYSISHSGELRHECVLAIWRRDPFERFEWIIFLHGGSQSLPSLFFFFFFLFHRPWFSSRRFVSDPSLRSSFFSHFVTSRVPKLYRSLIGSEM